MVLVYITVSCLIQKYNRFALALAPGNIENSQERPKMDYLWSQF